MFVEVTRATARTWCGVQELDQRYNALLQMYGEKVEEAEELRLDLQDVKDMYKSQVYVYDLLTSLVLSYLVL